MTINWYPCVVVFLLTQQSTKAIDSTCTTEFTHRYIISDCGFGHPSPLRRQYFLTIPETSAITCKNVTTLPLAHDYKHRYYKQYLTIVESTLPNLPAGAFANFPTIRKLSLNHSNIDTVSPEAFAGLLNLNELHLACNNITRITSSFSSMTQLETLSLAHNSLQKLNLSAVHSLKVLSLADNGITSLSKIQLPHHWMDELDLSDNRIDYWVDMLDADHVVLDNNSLTVLGPIAANTTKLRARHNKIRTLCLQRFELQLKQLDLGFNQLTSLKVGQFSNMERLERLQLDHNAITDVEPGALERLHQLRELDLSFNAIKRFEPGTFDNFVQLQSLILSYNPLIDSSALSGLTTRLKLDLNLDWNINRF